MGRFWFEGGDRTLGPRYTKYQTGGDTQDREDECYLWGPRMRLDRFEDFDGALNVKTIEIPLFSSGGAANQFATTGSSVGSTMVDFAGRLIDVRLIAEDALAANDTNFLTFTLTNNAQNGSGTTAMLDATGDANTTKATGGTAITAETGRAITVSAIAANLRVASGDLLTFDGTATGTLANVVDMPKVRLRFAVLPAAYQARTTKTVGLLAVQPVDDTANGEVLCALGSTGEANVVGLDWGDQVLIPANRRPVFQCRLKLSGVAASTRAVWGLASAYNATFDSAADLAWFRFEGNSLNLLIETDDGTTDNDDKDTGFDLVADTYYVFTIDMTDPGAIRFSVDDKEFLISDARLSGAAFAATDLLQPVIWLQKDSGSGEQSITVDWIRVTWDRT